MAGRGRVVIGIDYSLTCPAACIIPEGKTKFQDSHTYFLTDKRKCMNDFPYITGYGHKDWESAEERYDQISEVFLNLIDEIDENPYVFIEDYSMGSKGKVFHIAENTGILKYRLWGDGIPFKTIPPTVIKKFYTGKGNSDKEKMVAKFTEETGINLQNIISPDTKLGSPVTDIVDAWAIAKYGLDFLSKEK